MYDIFFQIEAEQDAPYGIFAGYLMWPHLFPLYASQIFKTMLANGIVWVTKIAWCCFRIPLRYATYRYTGNCITKT